MLEFHKETFFKWAMSHSGQGGLMPKAGKFCDRY